MTRSSWSESDSCLATAHPGRRSPQWREPGLLEMRIERHSCANCAAVGQPVGRGRPSWPVARHCLRHGYRHGAKTPPTSQSVSQLVNWTVSQSISHSANQPVSQPVSQPASWSIGQSDSQSADQSASQPESESHQTPEAPSTVREASL